MARMTVDDVPDELLARLEARAATHGRTLSAEVVVCLERALPVPTLSTEERLSRIRAVRPEVSPSLVRLEDVLSAIDSGRP